MEEIKLENRDNFKLYSIKVDNKFRIILFRIPDDTTFYVLCFDFKHKFYKSEMKGT